MEYLKEHTVDLVVLDMIMDPGMDGLDTYRKILEIHPHQKAIIVSGFSETERVTKAQDWVLVHTSKNHMCWRNWDWPLGKNLIGQHSQSLAKQRSEEARRMKPLFPAASKGAVICLLPAEITGRKPEDVKSISSTNDLHPKGTGFVKLSKLFWA